MKKKYYIVETCVFSTAENAAQYAVDYDKKYNHLPFVEVRNINSTESAGDVEIDGYTGELIINGRKTGKYFK